MTIGSPPTLKYFAAPPARRARFVAWIICISLLIGGTAAWLYLLRGSRILHDDPVLVGGWIALGLVILLIAFLLKTTPTDAVRLSPRTSAWIIIGGTAVMQALGVSLLSPALSEDWPRYHLDGRMWLEGVSPYAVSPAEYRPSDAIPQKLVPETLVPFRELHTIYPPAAQLVFVAVRALEDLAIPHARSWPRWRDEIPQLPRPHQAMILRSVLATAAIICVWVLVSILRRQERSPWPAVLLGWNPLFIIETGAMGHIDVVGVLLILLTIRTLQSHRPVLAAAMLALAAGIKPQAALLLPFLLRDAGWSAMSRGRRVLLALVAVTCMAIVYSPLLIQRGYAGWLRTVHTYTTSWEANGSVYEVIKATADETDGVAVQRAKDRARALAGAMLVATLLLAWSRRADLATAGYRIHLVALLFAPVVYPWYLLWALCFVPLLRGWQGMTALVWCATAGLSYLLWRTTDWVLPASVALAEYLPVYLTLIAELVVAGRVSGTTRGTAASPGEATSAAVTVHSC